MARKENLIRSISFLSPDGNGGEKRVFVKCRGGKFEYVVAWYTPSAPTAHYRHNRQSSTRRLTAEDLVDTVKSGDPVLELMDGSKLRVFLGGSDEMLVIPACIIESHDKFFNPSLIGW